MATIRQRANRWQCIIKRKGHPLISRTFDLRKDAERWARQEERLIDKGEWVDRTQANVITLGELMSRYVEEVTPRKRGAVVERSRMGLLQRSPLAKYAISAVTPEMIAKWRDLRLQQVKPSTVAHELVLLSHLFNVAVREWGVPLTLNPVSHVRKPPASKPRDRVLNSTERQALIASCGQCRNPWVQPVVIFAMETAARRGEVLALKWADIDLQRKTAKLRVTKTDEPRTIPLSPACIAMLERLPRSIDGLVFPVTVEALKQAYERAVARAGIKDFTFHDLRHDALTRLSKLGLSVLELRAISGHATANMLQRYVSIDPSDLAQKLATSRMD
jgi:integrase